MELSLSAARTLALAAQGLHQPPAAPATKADVLAMIRQMQLLQIDSISIVARSPYLVLWSRLGAYEPRWLDELLAEGALFEYWAHAACFLPIEDYAFYRRAMLDDRPRARTWIAAHPAEVARVLGRIREQGAVRAADFPRTDGRAGAWWDWKPEKEALECLFYTGELMCARRVNFQRVYDLRERVLPGWDDSQVPSAGEVRRVLALKAVRALGVAPARWVPGYFNTPKKGSARLLEELADAGQIVHATVAGWDGVAYIHPDNLALAEAIAAGALQPTLTTLLSPFDPLVSDRARAQELFGFAYKIETYTPAEHRRYGYFTLPILHRDAIIGRLDPKAHRRAGVFEVRRLHLEPQVPISEDLVAALAQTLRECAAWHETPQVTVGTSDPPELAALLREALDALAPIPGRNGGG
jgi:uncharacterized protein YcaQ